MVGGNLRSRSNRRRKKRKNNRNLMIVLALAFLFFTILLSFIVLNKNDDPDAIQEEPTEEEQITESENEQETAEKEKETNKDKDEDKDKEDKEDEEDEEDEEDQNEESESVDENEEESTVSITEVDPEEIEDSNVNKAYVGAWPPIGTSQEGSHTTNYSNGSQDRIEIKRAVSTVTDVAEDSMVEWRVENGGDQKVIATVSDDNETEYYRVYLTWIDNQGWQVTKLEDLKQNDKN